MFIELEPIFNNEGSSKDFSYDFLLNDSGIEKVIVKGKISNNTGIVSIDSTAGFTLETACDRCAAPVKKHMIIPVKHLLIAHRDNDDEDDEFLLVEDMHFNIDELVREDILLSIPTKVLCREDCKGLCQFCGKNLNDGSCSCKKPVDPRLAVLTQLLEDE